MAFALDDLPVPLVCPECRAAFAQVGGRLVCRSNACRRAFAIVDDIPALVVDRSEVLTESDWSTVIATAEEPQP